MEEIQPPVNDAQMRLAIDGSQGDKEALAELNQMVEPIISFQTSRLCKRFCYGNRYQYRCSLPEPVGSPPLDAQFCEWGNASYGWMLNDLCKPSRLTRFEGRQGASLFDYFYTIANSVPFYERWKDWRFNRRIRIPDFIRKIGADAGPVFLALVDRKSTELIASDLGLNSDRVSQLARQIVLELSNRHKLYLLDAAREISLSVTQEDDEESHQADIPVDDARFEQSQQQNIMSDAWDKLDPLEQYVIEALVIDEQKASDVLFALARLDIRLKANVPPCETNQQQLYYFKRKVLQKLGGYFETSGRLAHDFFN